MKLVKFGPNVVICFEEKMVELGQNGQNLLKIYPWLLSLSQNQTLGYGNLAKKRPLAMDIGLKRDPCRWHTPSKGPHDKYPPPPPPPPPPLRHRKRKYITTMTDNEVLAFQKSCFNFFIFIWKHAIFLRCHICWCDMLIKIISENINEDIYHQTSNRLGN